MCWIFVPSEMLVCNHVVFCLFGCVCMFFLWAHKTDVARGMPPSSLARDLKCVSGSQIFDGGSWMQGHVWFDFDSWWARGHVLMIHNVSTRGSGGFRDEVTKICNNLFVPGEKKGQWVMSLDAPLFEEVRKRENQQFIKGFHRGILWLYDHQTVYSKHNLDQINSMSTKHFIQNTILIKQTLWSPNSVFKTQSWSDKLYCQQTVYSKHDLDQINAHVITHIFIHVVCFVALTSAPPSVITIHKHILTAQISHPGSCHLGNTTICI